MDSTEYLDIFRSDDEAGGGYEWERYGKDLILILVVAEATIAMLSSVKLDPTRSSCHDAAPTDAAPAAAAVVATRMQYQHPGFFSRG